MKNGKEIFVAGTEKQQMFEKTGKSIAFSLPSRYNRNRNARRSRLRAAVRWTGENGTGKKKERFSWRIRQERETEARIRR